MKWRAWGSPAVWYPTMDDRFINAAASWGYNQQTNTMTPWNLYPQLGARTVEMPFSSSAAASCVCQHLIHWLINVDKAKGVNSNTLMKNWKLSMIFPKDLRFFQSFGGAFFVVGGPDQGGASPSFFRLSRQATAQTMGFRWKFSPTKPTLPGPHNWSFFLGQHNITTLSQVSRKKNGRYNLPKCLFPERY